MLTDCTPTDANRQTPVCAKEACFQQPVGWGCWVSTTNWHASSNLSFPPQHLQCATSHCPFHTPHHILFAIFTSSAASWHLPPTCVLGSTLPMALSLASLCDILYLMYKIHLGSPPLFFMSHFALHDCINYVFPLKPNVKLFVPGDLPVSAFRLLLLFRFRW